MKKVLIDCDPGIDDSIALILALKSKELSVETITTSSGNLQSNATSVNARKILEMLKVNDVPVAQGSMFPLLGEYPHDPFSHGEDGLGNTYLPAPALALDSKPASEMIYQTARDNKGELTIICLGPLTNIALTMFQYPDFAGMVKQIMAIAGSYGFNRYGLRHATGGNPSSEWNVFVDPEAAKIVFHSQIPLTAIGLDVVTNPKMSVSKEHRQVLRESHKPESEYFLRLVDFVENRGFKSYCVLIDSLAVAATILPELIKTVTVNVDVATEGILTRGQTVVDHRKRFTWMHLPKIEVAYDANFSDFLSLLVSTVAS